ncbi:MAG: ribonuclease P protein component [Cytophagales bacterium]|nr:ribonuclease P protein component [Cytophagales bacterium]
MKEDIHKKFTKRERLKSKELIKELFEKGRSVNCFPIRLLYLSNEKRDFPQVLITVSKKKFKRAVDRNRIRRQMIEAYRINKHFLLNSKFKTPYAIAIIYVSDKKIPFQELERKLILALQRLNYV